MTSKIVQGLKSREHHLGFNSTNTVIVEKKVWKWHHTVYEVSGLLFLLLRTKQSPSERTHSSFRQLLLSLHASGLKLRRSHIPASWKIFDKYFDKGHDNLVILEDGVMMLTWCTLQGESFVLFTWLQNCHWGNTPDVLPIDQFPIIRYVGMCVCLSL